MLRDYIHPQWFEAWDWLCRLLRDTESEKLQRELDAWAAVPQLKPIVMPGETPTPEQMAQLDTYIRPFPKDPPGQKSGQVFHDPPEWGDFNPDQQKFLEELGRKLMVGTITPEEYRGYVHRMCDGNPVPPIIVERRR